MNDVGADKKRAMDETGLELYFDTSRNLLSQMA